MKVSEDYDLLSKITIDWSKECCMVCQVSFEEGELLAINDGCKLPHPIHKACFLEYACGSYQTPSSSTGPNTLHKLHDCMICKKPVTWREWKYSPRNISRWKKGTILPDRKKIYGVHEYKVSTEFHFTNYITCKNLMYAIKYTIGNSVVRAKCPQNLSVDEINEIYKKYMAANKKNLSALSVILRSVLWKNVS